MVRTPPVSGDIPALLPPVGEPGASSGSDSEQDLWRQFAEAATPKSFCQRWLSLQCSLLKAVRSALVLLGTPDRGPFTPAAVWPNPSFSVKHLTGAAERALRERRGLLLQNESSQKEENTLLPGYQIAYPIEVSGEMHGIVVLELEPRPGPEIQDVMRKLHWGAAWLEVMLRRTDALKSAEANVRLQMVLDLVASAVEHEQFQAAAMAFVTQLATKLECDRVSLGFRDGKQMRIQALSHTAEFGKQMNLVRAIESVMDEAIDQQALVVYPLPADGTPLVTRAHAELSRQHGAGNICTMPLGSNAKFFGGLTLERPADRAFDSSAVELIETVAAVVGPILDAKRREDRWLISKATEAFDAQLKKLLGPGHLGLKIAGVLLLAVVIFFAYAKGDYRVTAQTNLEGTVQRAVGAPFNGYIKEAPIRAGDIVRNGEMLCLLDDRDLKLERLKWSTQKEQLLKQYREAMAKHDRAEVQITKAKIDQAEAQISLLDEQLARTKVITPFDGIVMSGDLTQSLGAPVERGQVLFEVAPLDAYRVIVQVDERDIGEIVVGQRGELALPSMPGQIFPLAISKITPVSTAKEGRNYFRVEAELENPSPRLRPGMEGIGKVTIDQRKLIWIWTHEVVAWMRLKLWALWP